MWQHERKAASLASAASVRICKGCFAVLLAVGISSLSIGLLIEAMIAAQVDAILSPKALANSQTISAIYSQFREVYPNRWPYYVIGGLVLLPSLIGYITADGIEKRLKAHISVTDEV
jgi:hypothetical protein